MMNENMKAARGISFSVRLAAAAFLLLLTTNIRSQAQQGSLADAARQARAERQAQPRPEGSTAQEIANQLQEDQTSGDAPAGFKMYQADGYKVLVPTPSKVAGHDEAGVVVAGNQLGFTQMYVMVGNPLVDHWGDSDDAFHDAAVHFAKIYAPTSVCSKTTVANHQAYECSLAGARLVDTSVSGNAVFVKAAGHIYPVFCVAKTESSARDTLNNPNANPYLKVDAKVQVEREDKDVRAAWQKCGPVLESLQIREGVHAAQANSNPAGGSPNAGATNSGSAAPPSSLAQTANQIRQGATPAVAQSPAPVASNEPPADAVPDGMKVYPFTYCRSLRECFNASVYIPVDAKLVSSECKQYVFETKIQGSPFLLMAGTSGGEGCPGRSSNDANQVAWNQLVLPETQRAPGTYSTISSLQATVDGKTALLTVIGFRKGLSDWRGKRIELESNGVPLVAGCMAPREHFADGDAVCSALINSLKLP
jgi:hypothetical protein